MLVGGPRRFPSGQLSPRRLGRAALFLFNFGSFLFPRVLSWRVFGVGLDLLFNRLAHGVSKRGAQLPDKPSRKRHALGLPEDSLLNSLGSVDVLVWTALPWGVSCAPRDV